jgi:hypothetical protein
MISKQRERRASPRPQAWQYSWNAILAMLLAMVAINPARSQTIPRGRLVSIQDNRLSVTLDRVPLRDALATLAHEAPFKISVKGEVEAGPVSTSLHDVELEQGLRRLLRGTSYAMTYAPASSAPASPDQLRIVELMVFGSEKAASNPRDRVMGPQPFDATEALPLRSGEDATASVPTVPPPEDRSPSLDDLGQRRSPEIETTLGSALDDPQEEVRATALEVLRDTGTAVPVERLTRLAREDAHAHVRMNALAPLADHAPEAAQQALEAALQDAEPAIRERAERLLEDLQSLGRGTGD